MSFNKLANAASAAAMFGLATLGQLSGATAQTAPAQKTVPLCETFDKQCNADYDDLVATKLVDPRRRYGAPKPITLPDLYTGPEAAGTVIASYHTMRLYVILPDKRVRSYAIALSPDRSNIGTSFTIARFADYPDWAPPPSLLRTNPDFPRLIKGGKNRNSSPLGRFAAYPADTSDLRRVHGMNNPLSVGRLDTAGCISMHNDDGDDFLAHVTKGAKVMIVDKPVGIVDIHRKPLPSVGFFQGILKPHQYKPLKTTLN